LLLVLAFLVGLTLEVLALVQIADVARQKLNELVAVISVLLQVGGNGFPEVSFDRHHSFLGLFVR
jgi:hypothetical protein